MEDHKNHSFISNFKLQGFLYHVCLFFLPVLFLYIGLELKLRDLPSEPKVKNEYLVENRKDIKILVLGASQTQRSINPEYLDKTAINLGNSSQGIYENLQLLKAFEPKLPNLELVILGLPFNSVHSLQNFTRQEIHHYNLIIYGVNTFGRKIKPQDYLLFHTNPDFFSRRLLDHYKNESPIQLNKYGFDINKIYGSYQSADYDTTLIDKKDIVIENFKNKQALKENSKLLSEFFSYCRNNNIEVLLYSSPTHFLYNELRDKAMIRERDSLVKKFGKNFPFIKFFNEEENKSFTANYYYNANHLNPKGAKKATIRLNEFIFNNYDF
ncbi:hypothetical protein RM549_00955 [Salegentibacter sp. F188]|uniref:SGNH/GDSL hydrolase family protein n=1 Tax=Autumnicola patrickiae TaxID=3075591 RepID=A0ABU3DX96_9FLAO|nr:hypothetical protein [Salegentibacter sp. F188]MDT0688335.1 hypothetical protein [Salegentibacter sp. F188]